MTYAAGVNVTHPLPRISLAFTALAYSAFGLAFLISPQLLNAAGIELLTPTARVEVRGMYGGLELGFGVFFAIAATRPAWFRAALFAQVLPLGGLALGRLAGAILDGWPAPLLTFFWAMEIVGTVIGILALKQLPRT